MFARSDIYFRLHLLLIIIHITCISLSLRRTSAPIHLTSVLGVLGTQEASCIIIAGLLERDSFDLFLPEIDKPWVIHLRETCCSSTNLCTWRPNTVYKDRSVRRHQALFWRRCRGGKVKGTRFLVCECSDAARCWWCKSPSSWEPQEEGMMSRAASSSLSKKPRIVSPGKSQTPEGDAC
jgi:hypothetical protein